MCYANGASAQLPSASPPSPLNSKALKDSSLPVEVCPDPSPDSGVCSSDQECSFATQSESQGAECDKDNFREGDTERKVACSCSSGGLAHRSESYCNQHRHTSSAVDKDRGSMEPVVTGRHLPEWSQMNVSEEGLHVGTVAPPSTDYDSPQAATVLHQRACRCGFVVVYIIRCPVKLPRHL